MARPSAAPTLDLKYPSVFAHLETIVEETQAFLEAHLPEDDDLVYKIVLLISEAATNAMEHGNQMDESKHVTVHVQAHSAYVEVEVADEGEGFNPESVADPLSEDNLFSDSGRGLFLMEEMADAVEYKDEGRRLWMRFDLPT